jgi:DNA-binding transcriptional MerR regulator
MEDMLQIGQLAAYVGVTTRTVRFYHQRGLLPEPERNASGYRSYGAEAVLRLTRIVTLASAGVPLSRIQDLLDASDETFSSELVEIDADLRDRVRQLQAHRSQLSALRAGDGLVLPDVLARLIEHLRSAGIDQAEVDHYRDVWILIHAMYADKLERWLKESVEMFEDPGYRDNLVRTFQVAHLGPDAPEVAQLASDTVDWIVANRDTQDNAWLLQSSLDDPTANELLQSQWANHPAWLKLGELVAAGLRERGVEVPTPPS